MTLEVRFRHFLTTNLKDSQSQMKKKKDKYVPRYLEMIDFEQKSNPVSTYVHTPSGPLSFFKKNSTTENIQENEKSESTPI